MKISQVITEHTLNPMVNQFIIETQTRVPPADFLKSHWNDFLKSHRNMTMFCNCLLLEVTTAKNELYEKIMLNIQGKA